MRTPIRPLPPVKRSVAGGIDLLAKPVQFVIQTFTFHVRIVADSGHGRLPASRGYSAAMRATQKSEWPASPKEHRPVLRFFGRGERI